MPHCESPPHGVGRWTSRLGKVHSQARLQGARSWCTLFEFCRRLNRRQAGPHGIAALPGGIRRHQFCARSSLWNSQATNSASRRL